MSSALGRFRKGLHSRSMSAAEGRKQGTGLISREDALVGLDNTEPQHRSVVGEHVTGRGSHARRRACYRLDDTLTRR